MTPDTPAIPTDRINAAPAAAAPACPRTADDLLDRVVAASDLDKQCFTPPTWLWHGYLGPGKVTLLTSQWKSGKSTLVSLLLARMQKGGQLAGLTVSAGKAFVISEESEADWRQRFEHLGVRENVHLLCRPFTTQPTLDQWLALIDAASVLHQRHGTDLVVIDSLAHFLPAHSENSAGALLECLTPLQRLASAGMSVLLPHHPRKGKTLAGQAARGSGALPGFVDVIIEMGYYSHPDDLDRRRRLVAFSRHEQTPRHLLIELQADGADYVVLQTGVEADFGEGWQAVLNILTTSCSKRTRQEMLDDWPADYDKPDSTTLWRWLSRAAAQGVVRQEGTGRPNDPFRYWLPARQEMLRPEGGTPEELQAWNARYLAQLFDGLETKSGTERAEDAPLSRDEGPTAAALEVAPEAGMPPAPEPLPSPAAEPVRVATPEAPVRLPYPYNIMNPGDVPEWVWKQARAAEGNP